MGWLCGTATSTSAADEDLDEEEMDLVRTEGPVFPPWSALAPRKSKASFMSRARGENNERGGAEGGFCAVLGHTHSEFAEFSINPEFST